MSKRPNPIRLERPDPTLYLIVKRLARENKRSIAGQAEWMIEQQAKVLGFLNHKKDYNKS